MNDFDKELLAETIALADEVDCPAMIDKIMTGDADHLGNNGLIVMQNVMRKRFIQDQKQVIASLKNTIRELRNN